MGCLVALGSTPPSLALAQARIGTSDLVRPQGKFAFKTMVARSCFSAALASPHLLLATAFRATGTFALARRVGVCTFRMRRVARSASSVATEWGPRTLALV